MKLEKGSITTGIAIVSLLLSIYTTFIKNDAIISDIAIKSVEETSVEFFVNSSLSNKTRWEIWYVKGEGKDEIARKGKGLDVTVNGLYPNTQYYIKAVAGNEKKSDIFTTKKTSVIVPTYFEITKLDVTECDKIKMHIYNSSKEMLRGKLTCVIRDDNGLYVEAIKKKINIESATTSIVEIANHYNSKKFDIFYREDLVESR